MDPYHLHRRGSVSLLSGGSFPGSIFASILSGVPDLRSSRNQDYHPSKTPDPLRRNARRRVLGRYREVRVAHRAKAVTACGTNMGVRSVQPVASAVSKCVNDGTILNQWRPVDSDSRFGRRAENF